MFKLELLYSAFEKLWKNPDVLALIVLKEGYKMISEVKTNGNVWYIVVPVVTE